jgi:ParB-like nuclease domain
MAKKALKPAADFYPLHSIAGDYADFTEEELWGLQESLKKHGLIVPIVIWNEQIVDGRHRYRLCNELGIKLAYRDITSDYPDEADMIAHIRALNEHRRARTQPLTNEEKRARIEAALKMNPDLSDRQIANLIGASHPTVASVRAEMEGRGKITTSDTRTDTKGRRQQSHKPSLKLPPNVDAQYRTPKPKRTSPLDKVHEYIASTEHYYRSRGQKIDEAAVVAKVIEVCDEDQLRAIMMSERFGGAYKASAQAKIESNAKRIFELSRRHEPEPDPEIPPIVLGAAKLEFSVADPMPDVARLLVTHLPRDKVQELVTLMQKLLVAEAAA